MYADPGDATRAGHVIGVAVFVLVFTAIWTSVDLVLGSHSPMESARDAFPVALIAGGLLVVRNIVISRRSRRRASGA